MLFGFTGWDGRTLDQLPEGMGGRREPRGALPHSLAAVRTRGINRSLNVWYREPVMSSKWGSITLKDQRRWWSHGFIYGFIIGAAFVAVLCALTSAYASPIH
jgi:hypothetical protein